MINTKRLAYILGVIRHPFSLYSAHKRSICFFTRTNIWGLRQIYHHSTLQTDQTKSNKWFNFSVSWINEPDFWHLVSKEFIPAAKIHNTKRGCFFSWDLEFGSEKRAATKTFAKCVLSLVLLIYWTSYILAVLRDNNIFFIPLGFGFYTIHVVLLSYIFFCSNVAGRLVLVTFEFSSVAKLKSFAVSHSIFSRDLFGLGSWVKTFWWQVSCADGSA
jgi:hypothetical protein